MKLLAILLSLMVSCLPLAGCEKASAAGPGNKAASNFADVPTGAWYADAVDWCLEHKIISGTAEGVFSPQKTVTRGMLTAMLYRAAGSPTASAGNSFADIEPDAYYFNAVAWAAGNGIVSGYGNQRFGPDDLITREQMAAILWRYAGKPEAEASQKFADDNAISNYAKTAVAWARENEIISGVGENRFGPKGFATRAQAVVMLHRETEFLSQPTPEPDNNGSDSEVQTPVPAPTPTPEQETNQLKTTTYTVNGVSFKMILVESGSFTMGSNDVNTAFDESPAHTVTLTKDYLMGETEVTEALWNAVMENGGGSAAQPKTSVTWDSAHRFVDSLNQTAHEQKLIPDDVDFHLPTEAQWEFAAKGGTLSKGYTYSGSNDINEVAVTLENSGSGSPISVKSKKPNELGLYDMSGNAYEWVDDYAGPYSAEDQTDPQNTSPSSTYVKRGGSNYHNFNSEPYLFTNTGRYFYGSTDWTIGFRICLF